MTALYAWRAGPDDPALDKAIRRLCAVDDVVHVAVMPDAHVAEDVCVGTVTATTRTLLPAAVGSDIGCGMDTMRLGATADRLRDEAQAARCLALLARVVPPLIQRSQVAPNLPEELAEPLRAPELEMLKLRDARLEFGTLGRGNHFVELQRDESDELWIAVHTGSRCMGPAIRRSYEANAEREMSGLAVLDAESSIGERYLADCTWAERYASLNRSLILQRACAGLVDVLGCSPDGESKFSSDHNHLRRELHAGRLLWVHRKGAQRVDPQALAIIPGSMGSATYHVEGRGAAEALFSAAHGAGRALSRGQARRSIRVRDLDRQMRGVWFDARLRRALCEEAPSAYKDISAVMRAQQQLVRIVRKLEPVLVYKAV